MDSSPCKEKSFPIAYLTRKVQISCCHRLHRCSTRHISSQIYELQAVCRKNVEFSRNLLKNSPFLNEHENATVYGKCNNQWGHGHNYNVEVTVRGPIDPKTGMIVNLMDLKDWMQKVVMDKMDHKNIDKQVDHFKNTISTTENIAVYIFEELKKHMSDPRLLYEVKVHETDKNVMYFRGEYENESSTF